MLREHTLGRLTREDNKAFGKTYRFVYDNKGNILVRYEYPLTTAETKELDFAEAVTYRYIYEKDSDKLVAYNGSKIYYNVVGAPTTYLGKTLSWNFGRELASYNGTTFRYNARGQRTGKNDITYTYDSDGKLIKASNGMTFFYDHTGVFAFEYDGATYYYKKNAQNDIIAILDICGNVVVQYKYDAWGNHKVLGSSGATISNTSHIGHLNPFRYRSYFYDTETGLYYLKSRYYDPKLGRFISPDDISYLDPSTVNGLNLYAYCNNNPVMYTDEDGTMPKWAKWLVGGLAIAGLVVATVLTFGVAGAAAATVGTAMLTGGLVSAGVNIINQVQSGESFNWTELAIATLSGTAYGLVIAVTGGLGAVGGKLAVAGVTSLLNSWNKNSSFRNTMTALGQSLLLSGISQGIGYSFGKVSFLIPKNTSKILTLGDIGSYLWNQPAIKVGTIKFFAGMAEIILDIVRG